jgi:hypothetical protein
MNTPPRKHCPSFAGRFRLGYAGLMPFVALTVAARSAPRPTERRQPMPCWRMAPPVPAFWAQFIGASQCESRLRSSPARLCGASFPVW